MQGKYTLIKDFWISSAHSVPGAGKCERVHGHNYNIKFCLEGSHLDEFYMLVDFRDIKHNIENKFDHRYLNDFDEFKVASPTTEKFAEIIFYIIADICSSKSNKPAVKWVEVRETEEAIARFEFLND